jgi:hypothetical protein
LIPSTQGVGFYHVSATVLVNETFDRVLSDGAIEEQRASVRDEYGELNCLLFVIELNGSFHPSWVDFHVGLLVGRGYASYFA